MEIQHFFAPTMQQALNLVKDSLGLDAIIFSHRKVDGGIEIEAAVDYEEEKVLDYPLDETINELASETEAVSAEQPEEEILEETVNAIDTTPITHDLIRTMQDEITLLRKLLENQMAGLAWNKAERQNPVEVVLFRRLCELGFEQSIISMLIKDIINQPKVEHPWTQLQEKLICEIPILETPLLDRDGITAFVGPTGVGKTTTISKIAARYIIKHKRDDIGLITTDHYRIAAREQLQTYGKILNIPVIPANNEIELNQAIKSLSHKRIILIDTAGVNPKNVGLTKKLSFIDYIDQPLQTCLVLSANSQSSALESAINAFSKKSIDACILTKLDEAVRLGPAIGKLIKHHLPLAYVCHGQSVPEDIAIAQAEPLTQEALAIDRSERRHLMQEELALMHSGGLAHADD